MTPRPQTAEDALREHLKGKFFDLQGRDLRAIERTQRLNAEQRKRRAKDVAALKASIEAAIQVAQEKHSGKGPSPDAIVAAVAGAHGLTPADIRSRSRYRHIIRARQHTCVLLRQFTTLSFDHIAKLVGITDHSTAHHAVKSWHRHAVSFAAEDAAARKMLGINQ